MAKEVAKSLAEITESREMDILLNRVKIVEVDAVFRRLMEKNTPDLFKRRPSPNLEDLGLSKITDLDLSTFLVALSQRNAVINLPVYKSAGNQRKSNRETVVSDKNRHGQITGLISNQDFFNFSVRILDHNVIRHEEDKDEVGAPRVFSLIKFGEWYEGWKEILFTPTAKENEFIKDFSLAFPGGKIIFDNFVHPARKFSMFGKTHFLMKVIVERYRDYCKFLVKEKDAMLKFGLRYPTEGEGAQKDWGKTYQDGKTESRKFPAFNSEVDIPVFTGEYDNFKATQDNLVIVTALVRELRYTRIPLLQYLIRCNEYAFFEYNIKGETEEPTLPPWIKNAKIEDYTLKGKKIVWQRLIYGQKEVGEMGFGLRWRITEKSAQVPLDAVV